MLPSPPAASALGAVKRLIEFGILLALAVALWAALLVVRGVPVSLEYLWPFGSVVSAIGVVGVVFDRYVWRSRVLHGWLVKRPDLRGTWRAVLESDWVDPQTGQRQGDIVAYIGVEQTYSTLRMHLMTRESESWLISHRIQPSSKTDGYQLVAAYENQPQTVLRGERSEMHFGTFVLESHGPRHRPTDLEGEYWTDRKTKGRMALGDRADTLFTRFVDAEEAFRTTRGGPRSRSAGFRRG